MGDPVIDYGNLVGNETLHVRGQDREGRPCGETFQCTTAQIAALGGGGGYVFEDSLDSGTTATITNVGTNFIVNSPALANKTITIPTATGSKQVITITDAYGNAGTYNITAVPSSGSIVNGGGGVVYTDGGSITLYDSATLMAWIPQ